MAWNVTTEWEDIHVKLKNYLPKEKDPTGEQMEKLAIETAERFDPLENKTLDELKIMEEDNDEDEEIRRYKEMRLAEMKEFAKKPKFGKVAEIRKQDYLSEVNNAPKDVFVVLHLYQDCVEECMILNEIFNYLSRKFILVKFLKIVANNCVENFSDSDCPAVFIYFNGKPIKQFLRANYYFGGKNMNWKSIIYLIK
jgi:hypothetical protein